MTRAVCRVRGLAEGGSDYGKACRAVSGVFVNKPATMHHPPNSGKPASCCRKKSGPDVFVIVEDGKQRACNDEVADSRGDALIAKR